jgi:hypothetical protein
MKRRCVLLLTLAPAAAVAVTSALGPFRLDVPARGFEERCVKLDSGERVRYRYTASADVDFNIHYHRGDEVFYPVKATASRSADASFTAPQADTYCLMWERKGDGAARIDGAVERGRK